MHADMENKVYLCPKCRIPWGRYHVSGNKYEIEYHEEVARYGLPVRRCPDCGGIISRTEHAIPEYLKIHISNMYHEGVPSGAIIEICGISDYALYTYKNYVKHERKKYEDTVD